MTGLDEYLTVKKAADFLGVAVNTIRNWDAAGKIPSYRHPISNYRLFKKDELQQLLDQIVESGRLPTGWPHQSGVKRKPR